MDEEPKSDNLDILRTFLRTRTPATVREHFELLEALRPDRLNLEEILSLVNWVQNSKKTINEVASHVNIFGTGGDPTINISSMASIIASKSVLIIKVGTSAIMSRFGSSQFYDALSSFIPSLKSPSLRDLMSLSNGSKFISLANLGFSYDSQLVAARRIIGEKKIPDIYKVVFPFANYTNPVIQINGVSSDFYFDVYKKLARACGRKICIVQSEGNNDELMPGGNKVLLVAGSSEIECEWKFSESESQFNDRRFSEPKTIDEVIIEFRNQLEGKGNQVIFETIKQNASLIVACREWARFPDTGLCEHIIISRERIEEKISKSKHERAC